MTKINSFKITGILLVSIIIAFSFLLACDPNGGKTTSTTNPPKPTPGLSMGYKCVGTDASYYVFINSEKEVKVSFPNSDSLTISQVVADQEVAGTDYISDPKGVSVSGDKITLDPATAVIFKK